LVSRGSTALAFLKDHDAKDKDAGEIVKVKEKKESEECVK